MFRPICHNLTTIWSNQKPGALTYSLLKLWILTGSHLKVGTSTEFSVISLFCFFIHSFCTQPWETTGSSWCEPRGRSSPSKSVTSACRTRASTPVHSSPCLSRPPRPFSPFWVRLSVMAQLRQTLAAGISAHFDPNCVIFPQIHACIPFYPCQLYVKVILASMPVLLYLISCRHNGHKTVNFFLNICFRQVCWGYANEERNRRKANSHTLSTLTIHLDLHFHTMTLVVSQPECSWK